MTDKNIRHLGKTELLSIIRDQEMDLNQMQKQISQLQAKINTRKIQLENYGTIAEASLQLSGVFEAAQKAADLYLSNVKEKADLAEMDVYRMMAQARETADAQLRDTEKKCRQMESESRKKAAKYWCSLQTQLEQFYNSHKNLKEFLDSSGTDIQIPNREKLIKNDEKKESPPPNTGTA